MTIKSVYTEMGLDAKEVFQENGIARVNREDKLAKKFTTADSTTPIKSKRVAPQSFRTNGYWSRPGWYITLMDSGKRVTLLVFKEKLRDAIRDIKNQNPTRRVLHIEKHGGGK